MRKIVVHALVLVTVIISACKKKNEILPNNNEVNATVVVSPTSTITINAKGAKAIMGCSLFGGGTFVDGTNSLNEAVYLSYISGITCVTSPGTYRFDCQYRPDVSSSSTPIYQNIGVNRGSITFTAVNLHYMEGYFNAVCYCHSTGCVFGVDSVVVTGSFKGDYLSH